MGMEVLYIHQDGEQITDDGLRAIATIPTLRRLCLDGALVTDESVANIVGMRNVDRIFLDENRISDWGMKFIESRRPELVLHRIFSHSLVIERKDETVSGMSD
jgi:hypothetical protein